MHIDAGDIKKTDILFVVPPVLRFMGMSSYSLPLGFGYLCSYLKNNNISSSIYNADIYSGPALSDPSNIERIDRWNWFFSSVNDASSPIWDEVKCVLTVLQPKIIGISSRVIDLPSTFVLASIAKTLLPGVKLVLGGPSAITCTDYVFNNSDFDCLVLGEGEETFTELAKSLLGTGIATYGEIKGIAYRDDDGGIVRTAPRPLIANLDTIPFPDREAMFIVNGNRLETRLECSDVLTSRGCPYPCTFCCAYEAWGTRKPRFRSVENIVSELQYLKSRYGQTYFIFWDDMFTTDRERTIQICTKIIELQLDITWLCLVRINSLDDELLSIMKQAGCVEVQVGIESGNDRVLSLIKKGLTLEAIRQKVPVIRRSGLVWRAFFIIGFPSETREEILDTVRFIKEIQPTYPQLSIFCPYPGTELYEQLVLENKLGTNFLKSDMWNPHNNYTGTMNNDEFFHLALEIFSFLDRWESKGIPPFNCEPDMTKNTSTLYDTYSSTLLKPAIECLRMGKIDAAFSHLNNIKSLQIPHKGSDLFRALCFMEMGQPVSAIEALKEELRLFPANQDALTLLENLKIQEPLTQSRGTGDEEFNKLLEIIRPYTMLSVERLYSLYKLARYVCEKNIAGNFVECGVAAGGSSALLAYVIKRFSKLPRLLYSFDSFAGMPQPTVEDTHQGLEAKLTGWGTGTCSAPENSIREICEKLGVLDIVRPVKGYFQDTLPAMRDWTGMISLLHLDGDWYESTKSILDNLYDRIVNDGFLQVDDYGHWEGCKKALHEFERSRDIKFAIQPIDSTGVVIVKPDHFPINSRIPAELIQEFLEDNSAGDVIESQMSSNESFQLYFAVRNLLPEKALLVRFVEVGSYAGGSLNQICKALKRTGRPFQGIAVEPGGTQQFHELVKSLGSNVSHLSMLSHEAAQRLTFMLDTDNLPEFILIDGDHSYQGVRQDIIDYYPLLAPGGIMMFHDYLPQLDDHNSAFIYSHHANIEPGIRQACQELMEGIHGLEPIDLPLLYPDDPTQTQAHLPIIPGVRSTIRAYRKPSKRFDVSMNAAQPLFSKSRIPCHYYNLFINSKGDIYPCCQIWDNEKMKIGSVYDENLLDKIRQFDLGQCSCNLFEYKRPEPSDTVGIKAVNIELSLLCQAQCAMCCVDAPDWHGEYHLYKQLTMAVSQLQPDEIRVQGGEVLVQPESLQWIREIKSILPKCKLEIVTNGNISESSYDIVEKLFDLVIVSIVGFQPETYRKIMGLGLEKTKRFASKMAARRATRLYVKYLVTPSNIHETDLFFEWAVDLKPDKIFISDSNTRGYINQHTKDHYWQKIIDRTRNKLIADIARSQEYLKASHTKIGLSPLASELFGIDESFIRTNNLADVFDSIFC